MTIIQNKEVTIYRNLLTNMYQCKLVYSYHGAIGIGRKVFGDSYASRIIDSGLAFNPIRVNIL